MRPEETVLEWVRHTDCEYLPRAKFDTVSEAVVCGCGEYNSITAIEFANLVDDTNRALAVQGVAAKDPIAATLALIDPSEVYTPEEVERHILDVLARLETGGLFERETVVQAYESEQAFDMAYYRAFHQSEQSSDQKRKADAMVKCEQEYTAMMQAKMLREAVKSTMHNLRAVLSGYQSTSRSIQATYQAGGSPGGRF